jgi:hypothetical protein
VYSTRPAFTKLSLAIILVPIGLLTKVYSGIGVEVIHNHLGGVIYVIFWILLFSFIFPTYSPCKLTLWVFLVTCGIESTQLINTSTLELLRKNFFFRALFGNTFNPFDFICYLVGALLGLFTIFFIDKTFGNK